MSWPFLQSRDSTKIAEGHRRKDPRHDESLIESSGSTEAEGTKKIYKHRNQDCPDITPQELLVITGMDIVSPTDEFAKALWIFPDVSGVQPPERWGHSAVYLDNKMYIFGVRESSDSIFGVTRIVYGVL